MKFAADDPNASLINVDPPAVGVTAFDTADAGPDPTAFAAVTVNVYDVPLVNPPTVADRAAPATLAVNPPGTDLTVYPVIAAPPSLAGAAHDTDAAAFPAVATTPDGAPGTPAAAVTCRS